MHSWRSFANCVLPQKGKKTLLFQSKITSTLQTDLFQAQRLPGSRFLICSDGLTEYADSSALIACLQLPLNQAADRMMSLALEGGGRDNITLIVLEVPA